MLWGSVFAGIPGPLPHFDRFFRGRGHICCDECAETDNVPHLKLHRKKWIIATHRFCDDPLFY